MPKRGIIWSWEDHTTSIQRIEEWQAAIPKSNFHYLWPKHFTWEGKANKYTYFLRLFYLKHFLLAPLFIFWLLSNYHQQIFFLQTKKLFANFRSLSLCLLSLALLLRETDFFVENNQLIYFSLYWSSTSSSLKAREKKKFTSSMLFDEQKYWLYLNTVKIDMILDALLQKALKMSINFPFGRLKLPWNL